MTIAPAATLRAGTNDAVAQAKVTCDVATPSSFEGTISQQGISSGFVPEGLFCRRGIPLRVFIPARTTTEHTNDYALGRQEFIAALRGA